MLKRLLRGFAGNGEATGGAERARAAIALCRALVSERGEVSGARLAAEVLEAYRSLDAVGLDAFFDLLVEGFSADREAALASADAFLNAPSEASLLQLQLTIESPRQELFRRCNLGPGGTTVLLDLRRRLLPTLQAHPERAGIDADLVHLFRSWFNRGFLVLQRIDWRTSALILERLIHYEAVHEIQGWDDLRRRLESDRRCYAFFHPALPDEPLIFIEVALTKGMSAKVQPLLDSEAPVMDPEQADCAIFYSITNCQKGLRGVSFGNFLIKQVVEDLGREFPRLRTFATLSPISGFLSWLRSEGGRRLASKEVAAVVAGLGTSGLPSSVPPARRREMLALCAHYLLHVTLGEAPLDPVARFHLANGASIDRLNWMGDTSDAGLRRSLGLMANYVYRLDEVERNHEAYARQHEVIASRKLRRLARIQSKR